MGFNSVFKGLNLPETGLVIEFIISAQKDGQSDFNKCSPRDAKTPELIIFSDIFPYARSHFSVLRCV